MITTYLLIPFAISTKDFNKNGTEILLIGMFYKYKIQTNNRRYKESTHSQSQFTPRCIQFTTVINAMNIN